MVPHGRQLDHAPRRPSMLDCNFTMFTSTCKWANDHNNWPTNWQVVADVAEPSDAACLDVRSNPEAFLQSRELTARMFGPLIKSENEPRCLRFYYAVHVPTSLIDGKRARPTEPMPRLALLRRQMG